MSFGIKGEDWLKIFSPGYGIISAIGEGDIIGAVSPIFNIVNAAGEVVGTATADRSKDAFWGKPDLMQILMFAGMLKLSKTPEGLKVLEKVGVEFTKGVFKMLSFGAQASAANSVAAWAFPILASGVLERFGFLPPKFNANYHLGITAISGIQIYESILNDVADALPWNLMKSERDVAYPDTVHFAPVGDVKQK